MEMYRVTPIEGKGFGIVATKFIKRGTLILEEKAQMQPGPGSIALSLSLFFIMMMAVETSLTQQRRVPLSRCVVEKKQGLLDDHIGFLVQHKTHATVFLAYYHACYSNMRCYPLHSLQHDPYNAKLH